MDRENKILQPTEKQALDLWLKSRTYDNDEIEIKLKELLKSDAGAYEMMLICVMHANFAYGMKIHNLANNKNHKTRYDGDWISRQTMMAYLKTKVTNDDAIKFERELKRICNILGAARYLAFSRLHPNCSSGWALNEAQKNNPELLTQLITPEIDYIANKLEI